MNTKTPLLNSKVYSGNYFDAARLQIDIYLKSTVFYGLSCTLLLFLGPFLLKFIGSNTLLPDYFIILFAIVMYYFELFLSLSTNYLNSENNMSYAKYIAITGFAYIFLASFIIQAYPSMLAALACQFIVQLVFNFWYWPRIVLLKIFNYKREFISQ